MRPVSWIQERPAAAWSLMLAYAAVIYLMSSVQYHGQPFGLSSGFAVAEHVFEYALFGFLVALAFGSRSVHGFWPALLVSCLYGVSDELHQFFVPGRDASVFDVFADSLGCLIGVIAYKKSRK
jgi:VanZ family protein